VGAEEPLVQPTIRGPGEGGTPLGQLKHRRRRLAGQQLDHPGIGQEVALPQRVREMLLPGVLGVDGPQGGVDPPGRQHRMGVVAATLPDHHDLTAGLVGSQGRAQPRRPRPDHQDIGDITAKRGRSHTARPGSTTPAAGHAPGQLTRPGCTRPGGGATLIPPPGRPDSSTGDRAGEKEYNILRVKTPAGSH
jgi:hypothetical protein